MTTSGTTTSTLTALELITEAYELIRVGKDGESLQSEDTDAALRKLNLMIKAWQADGLHLWTKAEGVLFLVGSQASYAIGGGATDHCSLASGVVQTSLTAANVAGNTVLTVASITSIAKSDFIGVQLADGSLQWTTVSVAPSGSSVTLAAALTQATASGAAVYTYRTKILRPARLLSARRRSAAGSETPLTILERPDYFDQPNKTNTATPTMVYYDPQRVTGQLYFWSTPAATTDTIRFTFERPLEKFDALTNTADVPDEWQETIAYNLAYRLAPGTGFPLPERALLRTDALAMKDKLLGFDREYGSVFVQPDFTAGGGFGSI